jgi:hypothetical protein
VGSWFGGGLTGHGSTTIDSGAGHFLTAWEHFGLSVTSSRVRALSVVEPLQFQYAGSLGAGSLSGSEIYATDFHPIRFKHEYHNLSYEPMYVTHVFWKLPMGVTVDYAVYW